MHDERVIGRIITISHNNIIAEISSDLGNYINIYDGVRFVGEIGSYVAIDDINRRIVAEIIAVDEKNESSFERLNKASRSRYLRVSLVGEISNGVFTFGVTKMPPIFSEIKLISENDLQTMLDTRDDYQICEDDCTKLKSLTIGTSVIFPDYKVKVKLNDFFGFHFAVFGNTGAGKSNTVAKMIQSIFLKTQYSACGAKFVIFDSNGEYKNAFQEIPSVNKEIKVKFLTTSDCDPDEKIVIPVWALSVDDWAVLLHASEKTQVPILRRALELIRIFDSDDSKGGAKKLKKHILATVLKDILSGTDSPAAKHDKITSVLQKFHEDGFELTTQITIREDLDSNARKGQATLAHAIGISYGQMYPVLFMNNE